MFFIIEEAKETILNFQKKLLGTINLFWFNMI